MSVSNRFNSMMAAILPPLGTPRRRPRVEALFTDYENRVVKRTNQLFTWLLPLQWVFAVVIAGVWSPRSWAGVESSALPPSAGGGFSGRPPRPAAAVPDAKEAL